MPQLEVFEMSREDLALAWPLVRSTMPGLQVESWRAFARDILDRGGGVLAATAASNCLQGIACYEALPKGQFGRALHVSMFVTFELSGRSPVRRLLMTALYLRSRALGCSGVIVSSEKRPHRRGAQNSCVQ